MTKRLQKFLAIIVAVVAPLAWAQRAPVIAMVTDVQGAVSINRGGASAVATLAAELSAPMRIELKAGAKLSMLELSSGDELLLAGPATAEVKMGGIESTPRDRLVRKSTKVGQVRVREGGLTQAAIVLRAAPPIERLPLLNLSNTATLEMRPTFRWAGVEGAGPYRFELSDENGKVLHVQKTEATELVLPAGIALSDARVYTWEVSARRPDGVRFSSFADFSLATRALRERAIALRADADAPVTEWMIYALWLDGQGLVDAARAAWRRVAKDRPDDPMAKKLAGPVVAPVPLSASAGDISCLIGNAVPTEATRITQAPPSASVSSERDIGIAADALRRGKIAEAKAILLRAMSDPSIGGAEAASLLAVAYAASGDSRAAADWAQRALVERPASQHLTARASLNAAYALAETGNAGATRAALESAQRAALQSGDAEIAASAAVNMALLESRIGGNPQAAARRAYDIVRAIPDSSRRAAALVAIGLALIPEQNVTVGPAELLASEVLNEAYRAASDASDARLMAHALGLAGELQLRTGNTVAARDALLRAGELSRTTVEDPWRFRWRWLLGVAQRDLSDPGALATLDEAVALLEIEKARRSFATFTSGMLSRDYGRVYRDVADLRLVKAVGSEGEERRAHLVRAREVLELSHTAEIEDFFRDPCIARRPQGLARNMPANVAIIYPVVFADRTELVVAHASGFHIFSSAHGSTAIAREVRRLRAALEPPGTADYATSAKHLYDWLVRPLERLLDEMGVKTLVWIPDGALRGLPFSVLHDGRSHLVEKFAMAVTPLAAFSDGAPSAARPRAALSGLSVPSQGFPALPAVSRELDDLSQILSVPALRDKAFTADALRSTIAKTPVNIIHVASHGQFAPEPGQAFLVTYDGCLTLPQLRRALAAGKLREEPIDLLTLSACQTAAGDDRSALGLAGVAIGAGARSVLATLWSVADESSALLVAGFYRRLLVPGASKSAALRDAQVELIRSERFSHPAYWAPYLLIGNWN